MKSPAKKGAPVHDVKVDRFGRVVIPKDVRSQFGLSTGDSILMRITSEGVLLSPAHKETYFRDEDGVLVFIGKADADLDDAIRKHRDDRITTLGS